MNIQLKSPLVPDAVAQLTKTIKVGGLINQYQKELKIDVSKYFGSYNEIGLYKCSKSGYEFYYPFDLDGDSSFYKKLQEYEWYYMPWKWEHSKVQEVLNGNEHILEVGSGDFGFVSKLQKSNYNITGLELNEDSIRKAKELHLNAKYETIQEHSKNNNNKYDVVCSFQVLEHIAEVRSFIQAQIDCLKQNGKLIVAVPNNDSFLKLSGGGLLNKPPHHMGLWNETSLKGLADYFNLKIEKIYYEPLQNYHINWYIDSIIKFKIKPYKVFNKVFKKLELKRLLTQYVRLNQKNIKGHTMLVIYKKA